MKRYFFHILSEECLLDTRGHVCQSDDDAVSFGRAHLDYLRNSCGAEDFIGGLHIVDIGGRTVATLSAETVGKSAPVRHSPLDAGGRRDDEPQLSPAEQ